MSPQLFKKAGQALFGISWAIDMGEALEINTRTILRWAKGDMSPIPEPVCQRVLSLLKARGKELERLCIDIELSMLVA